ncbi:AsmA family protein [Pelagibacteraceae bacterium]|nr:AsmA family protein [Pelagibacteraceae bacterium]
MNKKLIFIFKDKKNYKIFLYSLIFIVLISFVYFFIPKFFSYTPKLIQESLKKNSNINVKNITNINYKFFPSPRLRLSGVDLEFGENIFGVENTQVDIVFNPLSILNYKILDYKSFLIRGGSTNIEIYNTDLFFGYIKKKKKKINFSHNTIYFLAENKKLFKINDGYIKLDVKNNNQQLSINGLFLNHKISFIIKEKNNSKINIALKVPELDITTNILLEKINNFKTLKGKINFEILNNFFKFDFIQEKNIIINNGFVRSNLINSSLSGEVSFKPFFSFDLDIKPSSLNIKKLIFIIKQKYFLENSHITETVKKINGSLNFKETFSGRVIFKNREILFQNFELGKKKQTFFDAKILKFGTKGKVEFNLINNFKNIKISGFIIPSSLKVNFEKIIFDKEIFTSEKIKIYEKRFKNQVILNSLENIFDEIKINNFFKTF